MASGYEKADCGVDPNYGWRGEPDSPEYRRKLRRENMIFTGVAIVYSLFFWTVMLILPILRLTGVFNGD